MPVMTAGLTETSGTIQRDSSSFGHCKVLNYTMLIYPNPRLLPVWITENLGGALGMS